MTRVFVLVLCHWMIDTCECSSTVSWNVWHVWMFQYCVMEWLTRVNVPVLCHGMIDTCECFSIVSWNDWHVWMFQYCVMECPRVAGRVTKHDISPSWCTRARNFNIWYDAFDVQQGRNNWATTDHFALSFISDA